MGLLDGKTGLIFNIANDRSIAWGIADVLHRAGADLAFTYQGETFRKRVLPLVAPLNPSAVIDCDVTNQGSVDAVFDELRTKTHLSRIRTDRPPRVVHDAGSERRDRFTDGEENLKHFGAAVHYF